MKARWLLLLFLVNLIVAIGVAVFTTTPGYMDAEYYYAGGQSLASGQGFSEPFLWNYLDRPAGLPHASHLYWMPLASLLAALGMRLAGNLSFLAAQIPFILITAAVGPLTGWLAFRLTGKITHALLAGLLAAFSGFYLPYAATSDTFAVYMVCGAAFILIGGSFLKTTSGTGKAGAVLSLGLIAGLMHLSRADGVLWAGLAGLLVVVELIVRLRPRNNAHSFLHTGGTRPILILFGFIGLIALGYLLVMSPWYLRNLRLFGSLFAPGSSHTLWLTNYNDMFVLDPTGLNLQAWLSSGAGGLLLPRWEALKTNLTTVLVVQGGIFLAPLILAGAWSLRKDPRVRLAGLAWGMVFLAMTLIFPLAGYRGGFLHSGAAVQPMGWALVPVGLEAFIRWGGRVRRWNQKQAWRVFSVGVVGLVLLTSGLVFKLKVIGSQPGVYAWNESFTNQVRLGQSLEELGVDAGAVIMVNNPPGFYLATGRPAVVIPTGSETDILQAAEKYSVDYVFLDENHVAPLDPLYENPESARHLQYLKTVDGTHLFEVVQ